MTFDDPQLHNFADRIISIEMFEHMKNYELLLDKISVWMKPQGKLFIHIFTHKVSPWLVFSFCPQPFSHSLDAVPLC